MAAKRPLIMVLKDSDSDMGQTAAKALKQLRWESADAVLRVLEAIDKRDVAGSERFGVRIATPQVFLRTIGDKP